MIVPITRKEKLLNAIATSGNVDFSPKTRQELFLFKILGADVNTPTPITRKELLYQHIIDGTLPTFEPRTRLEKFIMVAAGAELELPVVLTREERWWAEIADSAYETITGAIVHFIAKRARAIKSLIANISYTQDLHGYISGWTGANVTRTGKNLFDIPASVTKDGITFTKDSDGYVTASPNSGDPRSWGKNNAQFLVNLAPGNYKFVIKLKTPSASQYSGWEIYSPTGVKIAGSSGGKFRADEVAAFTASEFGNYYIMAKLHTSASRLMVVKDGADTSNYEPYTGDTYSITFPAAAGTVYGGTLDVTTGKLTVTMAMRSLNGTENWAKHGSIASWFYVDTIFDNCYVNNSLSGFAISSQYTQISYTNASVLGNGEFCIGLPINGIHNRIVIKDTAYNTVAEFKASLASNNVQICYELATPQTYQLTPTEVTTLLGNNTIWADTGDVTVTY